jgi:hypothetical protein
MIHDAMLRAIHKRIDEHHACLADRLDALQSEVRALHQTLANRMDAHEAYHRTSEHRFGMLRLAERHPLRLAMLAFLGGGVALAAAPDRLRWLAAAVGGWICQLL